MNQAVITKTKIGKSPVVILPLKTYERIQEDVAMLQSKLLPKEIAKSRADVTRGRVVSLEELGRLLKLSK